MRFVQELCNEAIIDVYRMDCLLLQTTQNQNMTRESINQHLDIYLASESKSNIANLVYHTYRTGKAIDHDGLRRLSGIDYRKTTKDGKSCSSTRSYRLPYFGRFIGN